MSTQACFVPLGLLELEKPLTTVHRPAGIEAVLDTVNPVSAVPARRPPRPQGTPALEAVDWLRGLAVLLMIQTHLYDSWCNKAAKATAVYAWTRFDRGDPLPAVPAAGRRLDGHPLREPARRQGRPRRRWCGRSAKRGLEVILLGYLFRLQEYVLGGCWDWHDLYRVDILNCIGASMVVASVITAPMARQAGLSDDGAGDGGGGGAGADHRAAPFPVVPAAAAHLVPGRRAADGLVPAVPLAGLAARRRARSAITGCAAAPTRASRRSPSSSPAWSAG